MSILTSLYRQSLIAQKNNLQYQILQNSPYRQSLMSNPYFSGNLQEVNNIETAMTMENVSASAQLMAINTELDSLNSSRLNYLA